MVDLHCHILPALDDGAQGLQEALQVANIPLRVHPGAEVHLYEGLVQSLRREKVMTLANGGRYLLVELPVMSMPTCTEPVLNELRLAGVTPIIAHPERNVVLREQPEVLEAWVRQGVLAQLTAGALLGEMGRRAQTLAERLVQQGLVQAIASDAHDPQRRRPVLLAALERVAEVASEEVRGCLVRNARAILQGDPCEAVLPVERQRKRLLRWFSF
jgi:protein-tyrosine phosphatase